MGFQGDMTHEVMKDLLGDGIFAVDGEKWKQQRKIASFEFSTKILRNYSTVVFKNSAIRLTKIISELASSNQMMDIQVIFFTILSFSNFCSKLIPIHHFSIFFLSLSSRFPLLFHFCFNYYMLHILGFIDEIRYGFNIQNWVWC
jgi:hypothetical protein